MHIEQKKGKNQLILCKKTTFLLKLRRFLLFLSEIGGMSQEYFLINKSE